MLLNNFYVFFSCFQLETSALLAKDKSIKSKHSFELKSQKQQVGFYMYYYFFINNTYIANPATAPTICVVYFTFIFLQKENRYQTIKGD